MELAKLFDCMAESRSLSDTLSAMASALAADVASDAYGCALCLGSGGFETVAATGISARHWTRLDELLNLPDTPLEGISPMPAGKAFPLPEAAFLLKLRIGAPDEPPLGVFFFFLNRLPAAGLPEPAGPARQLAAILLDRQRLQEQIARQRDFDPLTGLPNRRQCEAHMEEAVRRAGEFSLVLIGVDRLHLMREVHGHDTADRLLALAGRRLRNECKDGELLARVSSEEFAVLAAGPEEEVVAFAVRLLDSFSEPFEIAAAGTRMLAGASAGVARFPADGASPRRLMSAAEGALREARRERGRRLAVFRPRIHRKTIDGEDTEQYLTGALSGGRFELFYQPQFSMSGPLCGFEALLRLRAADGRFISPGVFLPAAEESELIVPIGQWVLDEACRQSALWTPDAPPRRMAINVSPAQLAQPDFADCVRAALERHRIPPGAVDIELTESALALDLDGAAQRLRDLRKLGVGISIDDFGTGYSSLSYLHEFEVDQVKIDQSFVAKMQSHTASYSVVEAIVSVSRSIGARVLAEGVETAEQYRLLRELGCHEVQGYLFAKPLPAAEALAFAQGPAAGGADSFLS